MLNMTMNCRKFCHTQKSLKHKKIQFLSVNLVKGQFFPGWGWGGGEMGVGGESFPAIYKADGNTKRSISKRFGIACLHDL